MSRHRDFRRVNPREEYADVYEDVYPQSVDDDSCMSPDTRQYMYSRPGNERTISSSSSNDQATEAIEEITATIPIIPKVNEQSLGSVDMALLASCVEYLQNIVGDTVPETELKNAALESGFNCELAGKLILDKSCASPAQPHVPSISISQPKPSSTIPNQPVSSTSNDLSQMEWNFFPTTFTKPSGGSSTAIPKQANTILSNVEIPPLIGSDFNFAMSEDLKSDWDDFSVACEYTDPLASNHQDMSLLALAKKEFDKHEWDKPLVEQDKDLRMSMFKSSMLARPSPLGVLFCSKWLPSRSRCLPRKHNVQSLVKPSFNSSVKRFDFSTLSSDELSARSEAKFQAFWHRKNAGPQFSFATKPSDEDSEVAAINKRVRQASITPRPSLDGSTSKRQPGMYMSPRASLDGSTSKRQLKTSAGTSGSSANSPRASPTATPVKQLANVPKFDPDVTLKEYKQVMTDHKELINLVVIGHVDAGKSTLMGHLLVKLGHVTKKMLHRYETDSKKTGKSSFMYAWVLDETDEERSRGITMDIAESHFSTPRMQVTLLDAPGHKDFIPNMIMGASQADAAILVIDATKGEFETGFEDGGQTKEHTLLARSLGVNQVIVAINKLDTVGWSRERYEAITDKLTAFLKHAGFKEGDVRFVPCSGLSGQNLVSPITEPALSSWYSGPSLLDLIDSFRPPERPVTKPMRMSISDIFKGNITGIALSGRIQTGGIKLGQKCIIQPSGEICTVKHITVNEEPENRAFAGTSVVLTISGADLNNLSIGDVLCEASLPVSAYSAFEARIVLFNNLQVPITKGFSVEVHVQSVSQGGSIHKILAQLSRSTGEVVRRKPRFLTSNSSALVEITLVKPICLELFKENKDLGRFMLRAGGSTVAAGVVTRLLR